MLIFSTVLILLLTALGLLLLRALRPGFKYPWLVAAAGSSLALASAFLWWFRLPAALSLSPWQSGSGGLQFPTWVADDLSWPYTLALLALTAAAVWTSVVRSENTPRSLASMLLLAALGVTAAAAGNPLTLLLVWSAIDLSELASLLGVRQGEQQDRNAILTFCLRLTGTCLAVWALLDAAAQGTPAGFVSVNPRASLLFILAAGIRMGVFLPYTTFQKENGLQRGYGTLLRLVSALASLVLLARLSPPQLDSLPVNLLSLLASAVAVYSGWMWLRASDEIIGRPFMVLGMNSLAITASLAGNPAGSLAWGTALLLCGGTLFLYSARQRSSFWLVLISLWNLSSLPMSLTASTWDPAHPASWPTLIPLVLSQALLIAGYLRHMHHPGETSLESQERWSRVIYPTGLALTIGAGILLGLWGWSGAHQVGTWWLAVVAILLAGLVYFLARNVLNRFDAPAAALRFRLQRLDWLPRSLGAGFSLFRQLAELITSTLEGDGGLLWSLLLLVLILSLLATGGGLP